MLGYFESVLLPLLKLSTISYRPSFFTEILLQGDGNPEFFGYLKTTWNRDPSSWFHDQPRLRSEAIKAGFQLVQDGCDGDYPLPGHFFTDEFDTLKDRGGEILLIYGKRGYIAGISGVTPVKDANSTNLKFFNHPTFQKVNGSNFDENYVGTIYFIPPSEVCSGRSKAEFEKQGTGTGIYIVNGPNVSDLISVPRYAPKANNKKFFRGGCYENMGYHYSLIDPSDPNSVGENCTATPSVQALYAAQPPNELIGAAFHTPFIQDGDRWEPSNRTFNKIFFGDVYPPCFDDLADKGRRTLHVYVRDFNQTCS